MQFRPTSRPGLERFRSGLRHRRSRRGTERSPNGGAEACARTGNPGKGGTRVLGLDVVPGLWSRRPGGRRGTGRDRRRCGCDGWNRGQCTEACRGQRHDDRGRREDPQDTTAQGRLRSRPPYLYAHSLPFSLIGRRTDLMVGGSRGEPIWIGSVSFPPMATVARLSLGDPRRDRTLAHRSGGSSGVGRQHAHQERRGREAPGKRLELST